MNEVSVWWLHRVILARWTQHSVGRCKVESGVPVQKEDERSVGIDVCIGACIVVRC